MLILAARVALGTSPAGHLTTRLGQMNDWDGLLAAAYEEGMVPLLYRTLSRHPMHVPPSSLTDLRRSYVVNARRSLHLITEAARLLETLRVENIRALPFKGPLLAYDLYGDATMRQCADVDLLIRRDDVSHALHVLTARGYNMTIPMNRAELGAYLKAGNEINLLNEISIVPIDLHWGLLPGNLRCGLSVDALLDGAGSRTVEGIEFPAMRADHVLLALTTHANKHSWDKLEGLVAIAATVRQHPDLDWSLVLSNASRLGCRRRCGLGLALIDEVLGVHVEVPYAAQDQDTPASLFPAVRAIVLRLARTPQTSVETMRWDVRTFDRRRHALSYLAARAVRPGPADWRLLHLPSVAYPLHYVIRPLRLLAKYIRALLP